VNCHISHVLPQYLYTGMDPRLQECSEIPPSYATMSVVWVHRIQLHWLDHPRLCSNKSHTQLYSDKKPEYKGLKLKSANKQNSPIRLPVTPLIFIITVNSSLQPVYDFLQSVNASTEDVYRYKNDEKNSLQNSTKRQKRVFK